MTEQEGNKIERKSHISGDDQWLSMIQTLYEGSGES
jgi:hypothetical protein